jgi:sugar lactone lactonase YvrE
LTSRISKITPAGTRSTVADNLPSSVDALGDVLGVSTVAFIGDKLYALISGGGCSHGNATSPNGVLRVNANGTTTAVADLSAFQKTHPVAQPPVGDFEPDGTWFSMVSAGSDLVAMDSNHGEIDRVTTAGVITRIADISDSQGHSVPTAVAYDGDFYVGNLNLFPISAGSSKILKITAAGQVTTFATGLTAVLGLVFDAAHRLYALETSTKDNDFPTPGTGKVVRITQAGELEEIATGLSLPTGMTLGPDGNLYVSNWGYGPPNMGEIVKITLATGTPQLDNISTRGFVQTSDNVLIGGFIVGVGNAPTKVIVRAIGPSLPNAVGTKLADPTLELHDGNGALVKSNDNWKDDADQMTQITASGLAPANDNESVIVADLAAGRYTAIVAGKNGGTGVGLVEIYNLK